MARASPSCGDASTAFEVASSASYQMPASARTFGRVGSAAAASFSRNGPGAATRSMVPPAITSFERFSASGTSATNHW